MISVTAERPSAALPRDLTADEVDQVVGAYAYEDAHYYIDYLYIGGDYSTYTHAGGLDPGTVNAFPFDAGEVGIFYIWVDHVAQYFGVWYEGDLDK